MAAQAVRWGAFQSVKVTLMAKLLQKQNVLKPCLSTLLLRFCRQTQPGKLQAQVQLLTHSTTKQCFSKGVLTTLCFFKSPQLSEDAWEMGNTSPWEESSAVITCHQKPPSLNSALTGPSNFLLFFSRSLATPSLPSTTIPPTRISAGRNLFYPSPLQADSLQFLQQKQ